METKVSSGQNIVSSKGKRLKQFLGKKETLSLAASIAEAQEKKVQSKTGKSHKLQLQAAQPQKIPKIVSSAKSKLKETKAMLVARRAQVKRDKVRSRKQRSQNSEEHQEGVVDGKPANTARKKVSFS